MKRILLGGIAALAIATTAQAQLMISANENKVTLVNGVATPIPNPRADTIALLNASVTPPRLLAQIPVPASVVGPPTSVAITPDEKLALVTANQLPDPANAAKTIAGNAMAVVDLTVRPPRVIASVPTGAAPAGVSINRAGTMALVANRGDGSVSAYRIQGQQVTPIGQVAVGNAASLVSHVAFTPDGTHALVTRYGDAMVTVLDIAGEQVARSNRDMTTGVNPYGLAITRDGQWAVVANIGRGSGDADTVSLIDLRRAPFRVVDTISVGQTPEGIQVSPDNRTVAVTVMNGSNKPATSPFRGPGLVKLLRIENGRLRVTAEAQVGTWSQGAAFAQGGRLLVVGNMVERTLQSFRVSHGRLTPVEATVAVDGGSAALRVADR